MKKILVITPFFYPHVGGSERYMEDLYAYIKANNPDISVDVLCYNTQNVAAQELYRGLNIYRIGAFTLLPDQFALPNPIKLINFLKNHKDYDLIHVSTRFFDSSWWAPFFARVVNTKIVITDHCATHPASANIFVAEIAKIIDLTVVRAVLPMYSKVFVQNRTTGKFLKETFNVSSALAYPGVEKAKKDSRNTNKTLNIAYVGRMIKSKGVDVLFDIAKTTKNVNFTFAGTGPMLSKLQSNQYKNIKFTGNISKKEINNLLNNADIFAYPSMHSEGIPLALIEAGERGVAVVATNTGAIRELIADGKTGLLVPANDKKAFRKGLYSLIDSSKLRESLAINLNKFVLKTFNWKTASDLILKEL